MARKLFLVLILSFLLNAVWENLHSYLYVHYQGGVITEFILFKAALFDAFVILIATLLFLFVPPFCRRAWLVVTALFVFAIGLEMFALRSARWAYSDLMPIIPMLGVGLTPAIQLALTWWASAASTSFFSKSS